MVVAKGIIESVACGCWKRQAKPDDQPRHESQGEGALGSRLEVDVGGWQQAGLETRAECEMPRVFIGLRGSSDGVREVLAGDLWILPRVV